MSNLIEMKQKDFNRFCTSPYGMFFKDTIEDAKENFASDIHFEPDPEGMQIRFRVHGQLFPYKRLQPNHSNNFLIEIKELCNFAIDISGRPQDSRFSIEQSSLDIRGSLLPTHHGEKIVLRLLERNKAFNLKKLGFNDSISFELSRILKYKNGVILVSGPTGSGKTTTLYSMLSMLNDSSRNIVTIEDPIEYSFQGINQVQVNENIDFAKALRSILRQDPDVILVGEIRDFETADLCFKAASTGHLVLSSIHANSASGVIERLAKLGIDPFTIQSNLRFSCAQRLVPELCYQCSKFIEVNELNQYREVFKKQDIMFDPILCKIKSSCKFCRSGIIGRVPILEYMTENNISKYISGGMKSQPQLDVSLKDSGLQYAQVGKVDINEILDI